MKYLQYSLLLILALQSCTEDIHIYTEKFTTQPAIYCLFDPVDTVHRIRIERIFAANEAPLISAQYEDSIYFKSLDVKVRLIAGDGTVKEIVPQQVDNWEKDPGIFTGTGHRIYEFNEKLDWWKYPLYKTVEVQVASPGTPVAVGASDFLPRAHVRWPYVAQQYLFVDKERPILVQWHGDAWNEMDITFDIMEQYEDSTACTTLKFEKTTDIIMVAGICEVKIPYELLVQDLLRNLTIKRDLIRRYFGTVRILIHTGNKDFRQWMETMNGINDFNGSTSTNVLNGTGFVACKWTTVVDSLRLDYFSRLYLADDPRLKPFGFIEY